MGVERLLFNLFKGASIGVWNECGRRYIYTGFQSGNKFGLFEVELKALLKECDSTCSQRSSDGSRDDIIQPALGCFYSS